MSDIIFIQNFKVAIQIGTHQWERLIKQTVILDIELSVDISKAGHSDQLADAIDYSIICEKITNFVMKQSFNLIEGLAEKLAQFILNEFAVTAISLRVSKPAAIPHVQAVGVLIQRSKK